MLGLLRRSFKNTTSTPQKKLLYISLVRSQLMYCSPLWRPYLSKDICKIENIQRRATKYVLNNYRDDYKSRLISLNLLPLMRQLEVNDILAAVKWFKYPGSHFNITNFVSFNQNSTRAGAHRKLCHYHFKQPWHKFFLFQKITEILERPYRLGQTTFSHQSEYHRIYVQGLHHFICIFKPMYFSFSVPML